MPRPAAAPCSRILATALTIVLTAIVNTVWAQDSSEVTDSVLTNPGARSIGLGGAFAAIADDATAAFANPAGLVQILRPELSAELRFIASTNHTETSYDLATGVSGLGFFSFVYPSGSWAFALYSHQLGSVSFATTGSVPVVREFTVRSFAGAAALRLNEHLSLGVGASYFRGDRTGAPGVEGISDADWGVNMGLMWKPTGSWRLAGFYRQGPELATSAPSRKRISSPGPRQRATDLSGPTPLAFPDEYGAGLAWQPKAGGLTLGFEWDRVGDALDPLTGGYAVTQGGTELHLGAEYAVLRWNPVVAFRAGLWREPDRQRLVWEGSGLPTSFGSGERTHVALGVGCAFTRFQIDAGIDIFDSAVIASASLVYSF